LSTAKKHYATDKYPKDEALLVRDNVRKNSKINVRNYFAAITSVDNYIGKVIEQLRQMNELENTIILITSDHGEMLSSHGKQGKVLPYLEAYGVPLIIRWPEQLSPGISEGFISTPDLMPTLLGLSGLAKNIPAAVQGVNYAPLLKNPDTSDLKPPKYALFCSNNIKGVISKEYTLLASSTKKDKVRIKMYDNINDPYQLNSIGLHEQPALFKEPLFELGKLLKHANDPWYKTKKYSDEIPYP
jgi:arylsulfatase A-like enzyme